MKSATFPGFFKSVATQGEKRRDSEADSVTVTGPLSPSTSGSQSSQKTELRQSCKEGPWRQRWEEKLISSSLDLGSEDLRYGSNNVSSLIDCSIMLTLLGDLEAALTYCDKAIEMQPDSALAFYCRMKILLGLYRPEEAMKQYKKLVEIKSSYAEENLYEEAQAMLKRKERQERQASSGCSALMRCCLHRVIKAFSGSNEKATTSTFHSKI